MTWETIRGCERAELAGGAYALWVVPEWKTPLVDKARWTLEHGKAVIASHGADDFESAKRAARTGAERVLRLLASCGADRERQRVLEAALKDLEALQ
jgi:hypothetical protein